MPVSEQGLSFDVVFSGVDPRLGACLGIRIIPANASSNLTRFYRVLSSVSGDSMRVVSAALVCARNDTVDAISERGLTRD